MQRGYCIYSKNKSMWVWALRKVDVNIPNGIKEAIENSTSVAKKCISSKLYVNIPTISEGKNYSTEQSSNIPHGHVRGQASTVQISLSNNPLVSLSLVFYSNGLLKRAIMSPFDWDPSSFISVSNNKSSP